MFRGVREVDDQAKGKWSEAIPGQLRAKAYPAIIPGLWGVKVRR